MTPPLRFGNEEFWLDTADAIEVERLCATDRQAGLIFARRKAQKASVRVEMLMMDRAPSTPAQPMRDAAPSPSPAQPARTTPVNIMSKIRVGDREHHVDPNVAREIEGLRGENAALKALRDGTVLPPASQHGATPSATAHLSDQEFWRAKYVADRDPSTPRGKYIEYLTNAHRNPNG